MEGIWKGWSLPVQDILESVRVGLSQSIFMYKSYTGPVDLQHRPSRHEVWR